MHLKIASSGAMLRTAADLAALFLNPAALEEGNEGRIQALRAFLHFARALLGALHARHGSASFLSTGFDIFDIDLDFDAHAELASALREAAARRASGAASALVLPQPGTPARRDWDQLWRMNLSSPESSGRTQLDAAVNAASDLWAAGVLLRGVLNGLRPPFDGPSPLGVLHSQVALPAPPLAAAVPPILVDLIARLMHPSPDARYSSALAAQEDAEECLRRLTAEGHITPFPLDAGRPASGGPPAPRGLHGRAAHVARLLAAAAPALEAPGAACLLGIRGPAGSGKTALFAAFARAAAAGRRAPLVASGKHDQIARASPLAAVAACARDLVAQALAAQGALGPVVDRLRAYFGPRLREPAAHARAFAALVPDIALLLFGPRGPDRRDCPSPSSASSDEAASPAAASLVARLFEEFFRCCAGAGPGRPLLLLLDDIQWADAESLALVRRVCGSAHAAAERPAPIAVCAAYRPPEDGCPDPAALLAEVAATGCPVAEVEAGPLCLEETAALVQEALGGAEGAPALAELLQRATLGNPFALTQSLLQLERSGAIRRAGGGWRWDPAAAAAEVVPTSGAAEALARAGLPSLSPSTRRALSVASLLGPQFTRPLLAAAAGGAVDAALAEAARAGLLRCAPDGSFRFVHDAIQRACLEPAASAGDAHRFKVGSRLWAALQADPALRRQQAALFAAAGMLAAGLRAGAARDGTELFAVARACLQAGREAVQAGAHSTARPLLEAGADAARALLHKDPSGGGTRKRRREAEGPSPRAVLLKLRLVLAESLAGGGAAPDALAVLEECGPLAESTLESLRVLHGRSSALYAAGRLEEAAGPAFEGLALLGEAEAREAPGAARAVGSRLEAAEGLAAAPEDRELSECLEGCRPAFVGLLQGGQPARCAALTVACTSLCLRRGAVAPSAFWIAAFGMVCQSSMLGEHAAGARWAAAGLSIAKRLRCGPRHFGWALLMASACAPTEAAGAGTARLAELSAAALEAGREVLDQPVFNFAGLVALWTHLATGASLASVRRVAADLLKGFDRAPATHRAVCEGLLALASALACGDWAALDAQPLFAERLAPDFTRTATGTGVALAIRLYAALLAGRADRPTTAADLEAMRANGLRLRMVMHDGPFIAALARLHRRGAGPSDPAQDLAALERLEAAAPDDFRAKRLVAAAAAALARGEAAGALEALVEAHDEARARGNHLVAGLTGDAAAQAADAAGRRALGRLLRSSAAAALRAYGAAAKAAELECYGEPLPAVAPPPTAEGEAKTEAAPGTGLDVQSLVDSLAALSEAASADGPGGGVMGVLLEAAGAQRGALLLRQEEELRVAATSALPSGAACGGREAFVASAPDCALEACPDLPHEVVRYVERTGRPLVLRDATLDHGFACDPHVARMPSPLSILCVPLMREGAVDGVLYCENGAMAGAFAERRLELMQLLGAQLAACLRAARFFDERARSRELLAQNEALARLDKAKDALLANTSHEMRTPCSGISGMVSLLSETALDEQQRDMVCILQQSADHLLSLVNSFLDLAALENGSITLAAEEFDPLTVVEESIGTLTTQALRNGVQLEGFVHPACPPAVVGDAYRLKQVLINLAGNAVKFFDPAKPPADRLVRLEVSAVADAEVQAAAAAAGEPPAAGCSFLHITVTDSGPGMAPEDLQRLFQRFSQLESGTSRKAQGSGLGLAITKSLVHEMRGPSAKLAERLGAGAIAVSSEPGVGSSFRLRVAVGRREPPPAPREEPLGAARGGAAATVALLAPPQVAAGLSRILAAHGHGAAAAGDAAGAAGAARGADALVVDLALWKGDARRAAEALARAGVPLDGGGGPPCVVLLERSAAVDRDFVARTFASALAKPVGQRKLLQALAAALEHQQQRGAPRRLSAEAAPPGAAPPQKPGQRILLVEDNAVNQIVAKKYLEQAGYLVDLANDGAEAVEAVAAAWVTADRASAERGRGGYGAILMDVEMPRVDGLQATALIRQQDREWRRTPVPIIAMTANASSRDRERCLAAGMDAFLAKPVRKAELHETLRAWVGRPAGPAAANALGTQAALAAAASAAITKSGPPRRPSWRSASPSAPPPAEPAASASASPPPPPPVPSLQGPRVLVAESDDASRQFLRATLEALGYEVCAVEAGPRGVRGLLEGLGPPSNHPFDLVLLDGDDVEGSCGAAAQVRAAEAAAGRDRPCPVLALSSFPLPEERSRCLQAGITDCAAKPTRKRHLFWLLSQWLPRPCPSGSAPRADL